MKRLIQKIKQFFCKHEETDVEFCHGAYRMIGNTCLTRGFNVESINMSCRTCGKELGTYRLHGKGLYGGVDNKVYDIFKVIPDPEEKLVKWHCHREVKDWIRQGYLTSDELIAMLQAEGKLPNGWITFTSDKIVNNKREVKKAIKKGRQLRAEGNKGIKKNEL